jgi:DNA-binding NarL/FixJ family response regulator
MAYVPPDTNGDFGLRKEVKLLVVDDHSDHFTEIKAAAAEYHAEFSIECKLVSTAEEALQITNDWHPSVVLVDLHVIATTLQLLSQIAESGPSVVATSERRIADLSDKLARYGAVGYVTRADSTEDIESVLNYLASLAAPETVTH